jgi:cytochrome c biogenesis protein CcdA
VIASLIFAISVGAVSSVNPCGFALLPAYFAHRLGTDTSSEKVDSGAALSLALSAGAAATVGTVIAFGVIGSIFSLGAFWLGSILPWAGFAIGFVLVIIGILVLSGKNIGIRLPGITIFKEKGGLRGDFAFGLGYGTASLTCTLPIFLSVTGVAITGGLFQSLLSFIAFGLGMGTVLLTIAVAAALSQEGLARSFKRFLPYAHNFSAVVLILAGAYVIYYWGSILLISEIPSTPGVIGVAEGVSSFLRNLIGSGTGQTVILFLIALFAALFGWSIWRKQKPNLQPNNQSTPNPSQTVR